MTGFCLRLVCLFLDPLCNDTYSAVRSRVLLPDLVLLGLSSCLKDCIASDHSDESG